MTRPTARRTLLKATTAALVATGVAHTATAPADAALVADRSIAEVDDLDVVLVPGAGERGTVGAMGNRALLDWIRRVHRRSRWTTSVCTGSLLVARMSRMFSCQSSPAPGGRSRRSRQCSPSTEVMGKPCSSTPSPSPLSLSLSSSSPPDIVGIGGI
ncbi:hypothetical protein [Saccharothrix xinjiangensis]|uniref:DJ-1/PfpI domain-containing protein n=1 Tax=Saccharothrix xinjiangensis TaxID=204798 RepID=A0ABV9XV57_9PSEU